MNDEKSSIIYGEVIARTRQNKIRVVINLILKARVKKLPGLRGEAIIPAINRGIISTIPKYLKAVAIPPTNPVNKYDLQLPLR
ncbi:MAG: hypothetical protein RAO92_05035 [Candidatus Euphemobacter frigidus]|nr:hypothetical protein [Candidatus Euphemobacter frigidus]MDP8275748.1 hypothetical protein [Candidatus Euphemobacter frigidus]